MGSQTFWQAPCSPGVDEFSLVCGVLLQSLPGPGVAGVQGVIVGRVEAVVVRQLPPHHALLIERLHTLLQQD